MKMKKVLSSMLTVLLVMSLLTACGKEQEEAPEQDADSNVQDEQVDIYSVDLEDYQGINYEGIVFDKRITFNGHQFMLGEDIDLFMEGTKTVCKDQELLDAFKADPEKLSASLECYVQDGDRKIEFEIVVMHNDEDGTEIREIGINHDQWAADSMETPNLVTCGFEFLGGNDITDNFADFPKEIVDKATSSEDSYGKSMELKLDSERDGVYAFTVSATTQTADEDDNEYLIQYVIISSVPY